MRLERNQIMLEYRQAKKKKRKKWYLFFGIIGIIATILIFNQQAETLWLNFVYKPQQKIALMINHKPNINKLDAKSSSANMKAVDESIKLSDILNSKKYYHDVKDNIIGAIYIPNAGDVSIPVLLGGSNQEIQKKNMTIGASTPLSNEKIGKSNNFSLGAHNMWTKGVMFTSITDLKQDDSIYLTDGKYIYVYKTYKKFEVTPEHVEIFDQPKKDRIITLYTCNHNGDKREIVQGKLAYKVKNKKADKNIVKHFNFSDSKKVNI